MVMDANVMYIMHVDSRLILQNSRKTSAPDAGTSKEAF